MSSMPSTMARCIALAAARPRWRSRRSHVTGKRSLHQPPLRPLAPNPAMSRSSTRTESDGSWRSSAYAVHRPVKPGADDGHVDVAVAVERRARGQVVVDGVEPEAEPAVALSVGRAHASMFDITCLMRV